MGTAVREAIDAITETILRESPFGDVAAKAVTVTEGIGPDERPYLHVIVSAADPDPEQGTWSREAVFALRSRVSEVALQSPVDLPQVVVDVYPESADADEGAGEGEDSVLAKDLDADEV